MTGAARLAPVQCAAFPNTMVCGFVRKAGAGPMAGGFFAYVRTVERSAWTAPCVNSWRSRAAFACRLDAQRAAAAAMAAAAATGFVPDF